MLLRRAAVYEATSRSHRRLGDLVAFRCAASAEQEPLDVALVRTDKLVRQLIEETSADTMNIYLSPKRENNFRYQLCEDYKANRLLQPAPRWLQECKEFLVVEHKASVCDGYEADDALGMNQGEDTIIVSLDKDLLQIPGRHYQWGISTSKWSKEARMFEVEYLEGLRSFYASSLIGDVSDNIKGIDGIGPKKADKALLPCETEQEMFDVCRELYNDDARYFLNLKLLWIWREQDDIFDPEKRGLIGLV